MEQYTNITQMLELMHCGAFCVKDGIIIAANEAAKRNLITEGLRVKELLLTGVREYPLLKDGCLNLTLKASGRTFGATITRMADFDVFVLEQDPAHPELQALALAAQELRTPLANIMAMAEELLPRQDTDGADYAGQLNRSLFRLQRIIGNMSDAYRYSSECTPLFEIRDICALLEEYFARNAQLLSHAEIYLHFETLSDKIFTLVDTEKLERAVNNILSNAAKYTPKGGTIEAKLTRQGTMLYLTVQDGGTGTSPGLRGTLFDRYLRQPSIEDPHHGIGLGMVLIRSVAAIHGGAVLLEQSPQRGMRLTLSLEICQDTNVFVHSTPLRVDYAGERDHSLIELSEILPPSLYGKEKTK